MQTPPPPDMIGKGGHNFYIEKGLSHPPTPPGQIGKGDHNFYKEEKGGGAHPICPLFLENLVFKFYQKFSF